MLNKVIGLLLCCCIGASAIQSGNWDVGGKVSAISNGKAFGVKSAVKAEYHISQLLTWRTDLELQFPEINDMSKMTFSVPSNLLMYPLQGQLIIDPYFGPGLSYSYTYDNAHYLGLNIVAGTNFNFVRDKTFGIEARYTFLFIPHVQRGQFEFGLTGAWEWDFGK